MIGELALVVVGAALISNFALARFLGLCPFFGVSRSVDTALGMSMAVIFVITVATVLTWALSNYILDPLGLSFLRTIAFVLVIASLVQLVEMVIRKTAPALYNALGIYLPLITTNCAVLGVALIGITNDFSFIKSLFFAIGAAVGWGIAIVIFAGIRERQEIADIPGSYLGFANAFLTAGLLAMAFFVFSGFPTGT